MSYDDIADGELIYMVHESSDEAKDCLFKKYNHVIDIEISKYRKVAQIIGYDYNDLYQDALVGFMDAINTYRDDKDSSLGTFISLCVNRKINASIIKAQRLKNKIFNDALRLEYVYDDKPLKDMISDNGLNDPLLKMVKQEINDEFDSKIKEALSDNEYCVYALMICGIKYNEIAEVLDKKPKQVDNTIQRIKTKIRKILNE